MPTYEYTCRQCGETIEVWQSFSDKPLKKHDECGGELKKVFHARGIVFKGDGFYATDAKPAATKTADSPNGESKKSDGAKSKPTKTDSTATKDSKSTTSASSAD